MQPRQFAGDQIDPVAQPQTDIGGHLIVAGAASVQLLAGDADPLGKARLDVHVHVFKRHRPFEPAVGNFLFNLIQPLQQAVQILITQYTDFMQHARMGP